MISFCLRFRLASSAELEGWDGGAGNLQTGATTTPRVEPRGTERHCRQPRERSALPDVSTREAASGCLGPLHGW